MVRSNAPGGCPNCLKQRPTRLRENPSCYPSSYVRPYRISIEPDLFRNLRELSRNAAAASLKITSGKVLTGNDLADLRHTDEACIGTARPRSDHDGPQPAGSLPRDHPSCAIIPTDPGRSCRTPSRPASMIPAGALLPHGALRRRRARCRDLSQAVVQTIGVGAGGQVGVVK